MAVFMLSQTISRSVADVFVVITDVANFPRWNPTTKSARKLSEGPVGNGSEFELEIKGFGKTRQSLEEFEINKHVRLVPHIKALGGGHRFVLTTQGDQTRVDHELEMVPKGIFVLMSPFMGMIGKKNLRQTADALKKYLEKNHGDESDDEPVGEFGKA